VVGPAHRRRGQKAKLERLDGEDLEPAELDDLGRDRRR